MAWVFNTFAHITRRDDFLGSPVFFRPGDPCPEWGEHLLETSPHLFKQVKENKAAPVEVPSDPEPVMKPKERPFPGLAKSNPTLIKYAKDVLGIEGLSMQGSSRPEILNAIHAVEPIEGYVPEETSKKEGEDE